MFEHVHRRIKDVQDAQADRDGAKVVKKWSDTTVAISNLPYPQYDLERFGNIVQDHLEGLQSGPDVPDLDRLDDLMKYVIKNPNAGKRPSRPIKRPHY